MPSSSPLRVIFLTVLIDLIGFGILLPLLPYVATRFGAGGLRLGLLFGAYSAAQFVATAVLGRISDRVGRRPVLLFTMALNATGYVLFAFAGSYAALFAARLVSGFASGNITVAQAYIADVTPPAGRSSAMGIIGAAFGIGAVLGPALGGLAAHEAGPAAPGLLAAALSLFNLALGWRILLESLRESNRSARPLLDVGHARLALSDHRLRPLMLLWLTAALAWSGYISMQPLHAQARWQWGERELGWFFVVVGLMTALIQGWGFRRLAARFDDRRLLVTGTFLMAAGIGAVPFLAGVPAFYAWTMPLLFGNAMFAPAANGLVSVFADPSEQGALLGIAQSFGALGRMLGPALFGAMYDRGGSWAAFVGAGAVMLVGGFLARTVPEKSAGRGP